jgi:hypothetical protein
LTTLASPFVFENRPVAAAYLKTGNKAAISVQRSAFRKSAWAPARGSGVRAERFSGPAQSRKACRDGRLFLFFYPKFRISDPENKPAKIFGLGGLLYQCLLL